MENTHSPGTACGGFVSLFLILLSVIQAGVLMIDVANKVGVTVETNIIRLTNNQLFNTKIKFGDNYKGMNVFIDYSNTDNDKTFNPLDNQYYKIKVYIATNPDTQKAEEIIDGSVRLIRCPNEEIKKYF